MAKKGLKLACVGIFWEAFCSSSSITAAVNRSPNKVVQSEQEVVKARDPNNATSENSVKNLVNSKNFP
jgi:hypothetical protein